MVSPGLAETNVGKADGAPGEEGSKTRKRHKPVEDGGTSGSQVHVSKRTPHENEADRVEGTTRAIDIGEELGSITLVSERSQSTGATVNTRYTNGDDGNENDHVHEAVKSNQTSILASNDKGRGIGVGAASEETVVVRLDKETDKEKTQDVEESDTPENLTDGTGERLERVLGLSSGQTDQLSSREGEGSGDKDGAETLEAVAECTRVVPGASTPVSVVDSALGTSTKDEHKRNEHENNRRTELQAR